MLDKHQGLVNWAVRFNRHLFIRVLRETMTILFPVALVGSIMWIVSDNLLASNGYLANILYVSRWLPQRQFWRALFSDGTMITVGWLAAYASLVSAVVTSKHRQQPNLAAGLCAMISYVLIFYHSVRGGQNIDTRYFGVGWFIIGVVVGYLVGLIFAKWGQSLSINELSLGSQRLMGRVLQNLKPFTLVIIAAFLIHMLYAIWRVFNLDAITAQNITSMIGRHSNYLFNLTVSFVNTVLVWLGFAEPLTGTSIAYSNEMRNNLTYALTHKSLAVPYPFTPSSLYNGFANFGGVGVTLALVIGIMWVGHQKHQQQVAVLSAFPAVFNTGLPILFGSRVFLNPLYLIPFVGLPILNMLIASAGILIHVIPPIAYPVPNGTPGILIPFIGTGGDWRSLLISVLLVIIDTVIYIPFVKLAFAAEEQLNGEKGAVQDENR